MLIKMRESKGFTLVELMIVVAIIGILAAVAVPFYQRYVQKSRLTSLVFPTLHSVQTNIGAFYSMRNEFPSTLAPYPGDASTQYVTVSLSGASANILDFVITSAGATSPLLQLNGKTLTTTAVTMGQKITSWGLSGSVADELGLK
jgi:type IV pilus assembly protein PilA